MSNKPKLIIAHLYPRAMNLYGDTGNRYILEKRLSWRGFEYQICDINEGDALPANTDIILGGGGQDASQGSIEQDLRKKSDDLSRLSEGNCVMLMVCGMYQLLGRRFILSDLTEIKGLGIMPHETRAGDGRIVGNVAVDIKGIGLVVGYENHGGRTYLDNPEDALGTVVRGVGNAENSTREGCRYRNIFGTYMHGPVLAKSPEFADELITLALKRRDYLENLEQLNDSLELTAREKALKRP